MEPDEARIARLSVEAILADLTDRRGMRQAWDALDKDIQEEIKEAWSTAIREAAREILGQ